MGLKSFNSFAILVSSFSFKKCQTPAVVGEGKGKGTETTCPHGADIPVNFTFR